MTGCEEMEGGKDEVLRGNDLVANRMSHRRLCSYTVYSAPKIEAQLSCLENPIL